MNKKILYIGGGFDILHENHKEFIIKGINLFKEKYGNLQKIIIGLKPDVNLNKMKGNYRPLFSYNWRKKDISCFLKKLKIKHQIIKSGTFFHTFKNRNDIVIGISSDYIPKIRQMENFGITVISIKPINELHTSTFEKRLFEAQKKSNCNIRKVGALLIRQGKMVAEGYSGYGNCNCCSKYLAYKKGGGILSKTVKCDYPHAEAMVLKKAKEGDDILITDSPCQKCAELIVNKKIRRVVYIKEYYDINPIVYLKNNGIKVKKSGI